MTDSHLEEIVACFDTIKSQAEMLAARSATIEALTERVAKLENTAAVLEKICEERGDLIAELLGRV